MSQPLHEGWTKSGSWYQHEDGTRVNGRAAYETEVAKRAESAPTILDQHAETLGNAGVVTITMEDAEALTANAEVAVELQPTEIDAVEVETLTVVGSDGKVKVSFDDLIEAEDTWYGPYTNLTHVTTPFGMYAVPYGKRMKMVPGKAKSIKHGGEVDTMVPHYEDVQIVGDKRTAPTRR